MCTPSPRDPNRSVCVGGGVVDVDGKRVGALVGDVLGFLGDVLGFLVGDVLGTRVGALIGDVLGLVVAGEREGDAVGIVVSWGLSDREGVRDGDLDGPRPRAPPPRACR